MPIEMPAMKAVSVAAAAAAGTPNDAAIDGRLGR